MIFLVSLTVFLISSVYGAGEFSVLHHAPSLKFKGHDMLKESSLQEVYAAALGFSVEHFSEWRGMYILNPFGIAKSAVMITVDGVSDIGLTKGHHFQLSTDTSESEIYNALEKRIQEHYPEQSTNLVKIHLSEGLEDIRKYPIFENIITSNSKQVTNKLLELDIEEDRKFIKEITLLNEIAARLEQGILKTDDIPDFFWFDVSALHALSDLYGENSTKVIEAKQLLNEVILRVNAAFNKIYDGHVLVTVIASDASHTRRGRSILETKNVKASETESDKTKYNLASYYNKDYPVIFNIILWFGIIVLFSLIAISMAIGSMDPGRDSIIYRMTSTRMKKDN